MDFLLFILLCAGIAAAIWYGVYRLHIHLLTERWSHGCGNMPDKETIIPKYIISYLIVQVFFAWLLSGLADFPAQH